MAGPITHIVLALKILNAGLLPNVTDHIAFIIGTSFPDIRYLGVIDRASTHPEGITWQNIRQEHSCFMAGLKFHVLVDKLREKFIIESGFYATVKPSPLLSHAMKYAEDIIIYDQCTEWPRITASFNTLLPEELTFNIPHDSIRQWHECIKQYCKSKPTPEILGRLLRTFMPNTNFSVASLETLQGQLFSHNSFVQLTKHFYTDFEKIVTSVSV